MENKRKKRRRLDRRCEDEDKQESVRPRLNVVVGISRFGSNLGGKSDESDNIG